MIAREIVVNNEISLRIVTQNHVRAIYDAIDQNRIFLRKWLPFVDSTQSEKDTHAFIKSVVDDVEKRQEVFTVWYRKEFAGLLGLKDIDYFNRKCEIGYWLIENMTGKGIMSLSVEKLIGFVFSNLEMNRITIRCGVGNRSSTAIPKKLGFTFEGVERNGEKHHAKYIDLEVYSLLKKEWDDFR